MFCFVFFVRLSAFCYILCSNCYVFYEHFLKKKVSVTSFFSPEYQYFTLHYCKFPFDASMYITCAYNNMACVGELFSNLSMQLVFTYFSHICLACNFRRLGTWVSSVASVFLMPVSGGQCLNTGRRTSPLY